ncbi:hypothetical protein [Metamycoplasma neophronis]|uniref:Uncharacterized protein n=1 Tax=Metamycoplasma neophronis TaxID=872983 RepID=A0ABY2YZF2_9BACT|nr:hypothetical protein [Metamycoplasma neophronis]TPR53524.1 hypothetical protein FJR74_02395 [Metamycoplasma neophronis]
MDKVANKNMEKIKKIWLVTIIFRCISMFFLFTAIIFSAIAILKPILDTEEQIKSFAEGHLIIVFIAGTLFSLTFLFEFIGYILTIISFAKSHKLIDKLEKILILISLIIVMPLYWLSFIIMFKIYHKIKLNLRCEI